MDKSLSRDIATVVRGILAERRMTLKEFAALMGQPNSSVARWINSGGSFKTDVLDDIADALGMDPLELVQMALAKRPKLTVEEQGLADAIERVRPTSTPESQLPARKRDTAS